MGWGRMAAGKAANGVGKNAFVLMDKAHHNEVEVEATEAERGFAACD
ncbi:MAG: hypothetical protein U5L96_19880 [Owenweeksia sp.]|nr:hypothetical protein [Owenweeksia sp.]